MTKNKLVKNCKRDYTILSDKKCKKCGKHLKYNLVKRKPNVKLCYSCFKVGK